jgi:hypothetical protein
MGSARKGADGKAGFGSSKLSTVLVYASLVAVIVTASLGRRGRREIAIGVDRA